ncbi:hypothetical protein ASPSYDRAFT_161130 [Aspergillus sydowii CBS 593.65]|uniref:Amino acid transporter transmembrane domain-containing protein n=1 Tax=Aspergillus sydowii CBS 593.65 TaxID=1036612 RepID=A0A1L9T498_9EURO|nr:uncharacterized protein ASPSYDRAFT_161130 [Aspergillus sydowii CBS 593.65]OJJ54274.1 hypothetical protein ASPSYDRAFT_161130 [Aspergillus sydowii CBS 593.65]
MSKPKYEDEFEDIAPAPSQVGEILDTKETHEHDAVFGGITEDGPNYRNVGWMGTSVLMIKTQIGLGVLSIPTAFNKLGLIPGVIIMLTIGVITTWSDYIVGVFKVNHRHVYGIDDAGAMIFGRVGREVFGAAFCLFFTFVSGSAMLGISISLNALSVHGACTAIFVAIAAVVTFGLSSIRTLGRISWLAWIGSICIIVAVFVVTIAVGLQGRPSTAPKDIPWESDFKLFGNPTFAEAATAMSSLVFAYCGTPAFFSIAAEMRDPREFNKALMVCQSIVTATYVIVGIIVYYYAGSYVASPALGTAGPLVKKVAYGIALPGLFVTAILLTHVPSKYIFVRLLRGSRHLTSNSPIHWSVWLGCTFTVTIIAYVIASGIPVFDDLVSLVGALLGTFIAFHPMACMWLYDNWTKDGSVRTWKWKSMVFWCAFVLISGTFLIIAGTYGSVTAIIDSYRVTGGSAAWSCADNSNST